LEKRYKLTFALAKTAAGALAGVGLSLSDALRILLTRIAIKDEWQPV